MFFVRLKIIILSFIVMIIYSIFVLYKVDAYIKQRTLDQLSTQMISTTKTAFELASITGLGVDSHTYDILNTIKDQSIVKDFWISRSDDLSQDLKKPNSSLRDLVEKKVFITKAQREIEMRRIKGTNNDIARISIPIIATDKCSLCHANVKAGDVVGSVNAEVRLDDTIFGIFNSMHDEFLIVFALCALLLMFSMMFSINAFLKLFNNIKTAMQGAINGDFSLRVKDRGISMFNDITKLVNRQLETLDKNITMIDTKVSHIFIYNKTLYSSNPLIRLVEVISEVTTLFMFKNRIGTFYQTKDVYKEIQNVIYRYIKYKNLFFAEIINGQIANGYKVENDIEMKVTAGEIKSIEKRLDTPNPNIIFSDDDGSVFISTSVGSFYVIDLKIVIAKNIMLYYSIVLNTKKEMQEKEKSITRIYNYMREARPIINNILLLKEIEESSFTDQLTKAYNRFYLEKYSKEMASQFNKISSFGVLMFDIDHFKRINDTYGHAVGDAGIVLLVETIRNIIQSKDKIIRYGGEEFVVILEGCDINEAVKIADRIRSSFSMAKQSSLMTLDFNKSVSVGVSAMPEFSSNVWDCIKQADLALYEAKENGRNKVIKYSYELQAKADVKKANESKEASLEEQKNSNDDFIKDVPNDNSDEDDFLESLRLNNLI